MHFQLRLTLSLAFAALFVCAAARAGAQTPSQSSSQTTPVRTPAPAPEPQYVSINPLAGVRYDNRFDLSLETAYAHFKAGPNILQGANLGGLNLQGSYWLTRRWGVEGTGRAYMGTSGAGVNPYQINGPYVAEYIFAAGPEFLGPHNEHGALIAHVMAGGAYGVFQQDLRGHPTSAVDFYYDQLAPAVVMGGHFDLNRSPRWVFRITVDGLLTDYAVNWGPKNRQIDINTAVSVGLEYKFKKTR
jgi:hypothetical protein